MASAQYAQNFRGLKIQLVLLVSVRGGLNLVLDSRLLLRCVVAIGATSFSILLYIHRRRRDRRGIGCEEGYAERVFKGIQEG